MAFVAAPGQSVPGQSVYELKTATAADPFASGAASRFHGIEARRLGHAIDRLTLAVAQLPATGEAKRQPSRRLFQRSAFPGRTPNRVTSDFKGFEARFTNWPRRAGTPGKLADSADPKADSDREIQCLAQNIYFEARGENNLGKLAVGQVVMNRVASKKFPDSICAVVKQGGEQIRHKCQFSWWCDGKSDEPKDRTAWGESLALAKDIYAGGTEDPTDGALWYHADYVAPYWRSAFVEGPTIGRHIFYSAQPKAVRTQLATSSGD